MSSVTILSLHLLVPKPPSSKKANVANAWAQHCLRKWTIVDHNFKQI